MFATITFSVSSMISSNVNLLTFIDLCTVKIRRFPKPSGNKPYLTIFQELFMLKGTTCADGALLHKIFNQ